MSEKIFQNKIEVGKQKVNNEVEIRHGFIYGYYDDI
jgi:hypothetical protein